MSRIIIADDDKLIHKIYFKIIDTLGHEIVKCYNGAEAVKAVQEEHIDLILLDSNMPEMNGYEACKAIRKLPNGITTPIIIVSADDSQDTILNFLNAGANDYILKPLSESILIAKLKNFLKTASLHANELAIVQDKVVIADQYKIEKVLGYGAHSVVFLAQDQKNDNRKVAVKLLNKDILSDEIIAAITELSLQLQKADLENVIQIYDFGQYNESVYIVLEYAEGGDFANQLKKEGRLSEQEILKVGLDISKALVSLEKCNLLHLDIKPENIMIHNGVYKLSDFGIIYQRATVTMPLNSEIWGTPAYSSPEILMDNENVSLKSDIYSCGVVLYEGLIGDNPFFANKPAVSMFRQLNFHPTSLLEMEGNFSAELSILIDMMLSKIPSQRPSPEELLKTFSYMNACLDEDSSNKLTYLVKPEKTVNAVPLPKVIEKVKRQIDEVVDGVSKTTEVSLHTKSWERGLPFKIPSFRHKKFAIRALFIKVALALFVFMALYSTTLAISSLFTETAPKYDFKGVPSVVICEKCGNKENKPVIDIKESKCSKCGGQDWYAMRCNKCKKEYPLNEDKFNDEEWDMDDVNAALERLYTCPFCKSTDTTEVENIKQEKR